MQCFNIIRVTQTRGNIHGEENPSVVSAQKKTCYELVGAVFANVLVHRILVMREVDAIVMKRVLLVPMEMGSR